MNDSWLLTVLGDNLIKPNNNNNNSNNNNQPNNINLLLSHLMKLFILAPDDTWPLLFLSPGICSDFACRLYFFKFISLFILEQF